MRKALSRASSAWAWAWTRKTILGADPGPVQTKSGLGAQGRRLGWMSPILLGGDALAFLAFAALGRNQHHEASGVLAAVQTAWPFIAGWVLTAPFQGVLMVERGKPLEAARDALRCWPMAWLLALAFRAGVQRRAVPVSFDIVAFLTNLALLACWRAAASAASGRKRRGDCA